MSTHDLGQVSPVFDVVSLEACNAGNCRSSTHLILILFLEFCFEVNPAISIRRPIFFGNSIVAVSDRLHQTSRGRETMVSGGISDPWDGVPREEIADA